MNGNCTNRLIVLALGGVLLAGCENTHQPLRPAQPAAPPAPRQSVVNAPAPSPPTVQKQAKVGVGKKGRGYGLGVVATPAASLFAARERLVFEVEIPHTMDLFKATEGHAPKSHDEFMEKIVKANNIKLPELPEGDRYVYDPKTEQLMVESPKPE